MTSKSAERFLRLTLYFFGVSCVIAFIPFLMPVSWMSRIHEDILGMGEFPDAPITVYLARSTSALYGMYGLFALLMARNIYHYERMILYHARLILAVCLILAFLSWQCGLPTAWVLIDAVGGLGLGLVTIYLHRQVFDSLNAQQD